jgi:hypothetical protein
MAETEVLLDVAREADYWDFAARLGEEVELDARSLQITARCFNTLVHFLVPGDEHPRWRLEEQRLDSSRPDHRRPGGEVSAAQIIDVIPGSLEDWVLDATRDTADALLAADQWLEDTAEIARRREHGLRLQSEFEQAEAHSRRWRERAEGHYGDIVIYELRDDTPIVCERAEHDGHEALLMGHPGMRLDVLVVAPDTEQPWRRSEPGHVEEYGRRISVREALDYAGDDHSSWVLEQTALALGATLGALRAVQEAALSGRDPAALAELTRLADHARRLSEGLQHPLA